MYLFPYCTFVGTLLILPYLLHSNCSYSKIKVGFFFFGAILSTGTVNILPEFHANLRIKQHIYSVKDHVLSAVCKFCAFCTCIRIHAHSTPVHFAGVHATLHIAVQSSI